jgi:uncharacterized repeat protein (TIGR03803 family)
VLHAFSGANGDGAYPQGNLVLDDSGALYGTTSEGGDTNCPNGVVGCGLVFKLSHSRGAWAETILHDFGSYDGDGITPAGGLTLDAAGNLYGTTQNGTKGLGTIFKLTPTSGGHWTERVLHSFAGYPSDGAGPLANVTFDAEGNLYGTTSVGGPGGGNGASCSICPGLEGFGGTVFEITP